jgi:hypothetical protein
LAPCWPLQATRGGGRRAGSAAARRADSPASAFDAVGTPQSAIWSVDPQDLSGFVRARSYPAAGAHVARVDPAPFGVVRLGGSHAWLPNPSAWESHKIGALVGRGPGCFAGRAGGPGAGDPRAPGPSSPAGQRARGPRGAGTAAGARVRMMSKCPGWAPASCVISAPVTLTGGWRRRRQGCVPGRRRNCTRARTDR